MDVNDFPGTKTIQKWLIKILALFRRQVRWQGEEANDPSEAKENTRMMKMLWVLQGRRDMRPDKQNQGGRLCVGGAYFSATCTWDRLWNYS